MKALNNLKASLFYITAYNGLYQKVAVHLRVCDRVPFIAVMAHISAAATYSILIIWNYGT
jgi:hypothetical protein